MGFFDKFKKKPAPKPEKEKPVKVEAKKDVSKSKAITAVKLDKEVKEKKSEIKTGELKGKTTQSYRVLVKPLVTEKATELGALNKYVFAIYPKMNKVEVKKAIRTIYKVEPVNVNIANFSGKNVRYGRISGRTKSWKKAIVTLKKGDKIEVYEGV